MITAQDIREKTFEKSKFGGYDMAEVDEFLEQIADDLTSAQKETAVLKSKMKVLVDKIEEYRSNETALNQSILSAQKLAVQIESEAKERAEKLLADAQEQADAVIGGITEQKEAEEKSLAAAQAASAKFFDGIRAMCNAQLKNIDKISASVLPAKQAEEEKAEAPAAYEKEDDIDETVRSIQDAVSKVRPSAPVQMDFSVDMDFPETDSASDSTQPFTF